MTTTRNRSADQTLTRRPAIQVGPKLRHVIAALLVLCTLAGLAGCTLAYL